jgi:Kef-type K+ transport system membrane component KefB
VLGGVRAIALAVAKVGVVVVLARAARLPDVGPLQLGIGLRQMGEFSFVIAVIARDHGDARDERGAPALAGAPDAMA